MKKKNKKKIIIGIVILIGILLLINFGGFFSITPYTATIYKSVSFDHENLVITYSSVDTDALRANAFKTIHSYRNPNDFNFDFVIAGENKAFWRFYLELNNIDSSQFKNPTTGRNLNKLFTPVNWESLANRVWDESDGAYKYVANNPVGLYISELQNLGFGWDYRSGWTTGSAYKNLGNTAKEMSCYVEGKVNSLSQDIYLNSDRIESYDYDYKIYGITSLDRYGFVCNVDTKKLFDELPSTFTRPDESIANVGGAGITNAKVVFSKIIPECSISQTRCIDGELQSCIGLLWSEGEKTIGQCGVECFEDKCTGRILEKCQNNKLISQGEVAGKCGVEMTYTKYRIENNVCTLIKLKEQDIKESDYDSLSECRSNLINYIDVYRIENNDCIKYTIDEKDMTGLQYVSLSECKSNLIKPQTFYRFQDNKCTKIIIYPYDSLDIDYSTLSECEENTSSSTYLFFIIGGVIILIVFLVFIFKKKAK